MQLRRTQVHPLIAAWCLLGVALAGLVAAAIVRTNDTESGSHTVAVSTFGGGVSVAEMEYVWHDSNWLPADHSALTKAIVDAANAIALDRLDIRDLFPGPACVSMHSEPEETELHLTLSLWAQSHEEFDRLRALSKSLSSEIEAAVSGILRNDELEWQQANQAPIVRTTHVWTSADEYTAPIRLVAIDFSVDGVVPDEPAFVGAGSEAKVTVHEYTAKRLVLLLRCDRLPSGGTCSYPLDLSQATPTTSVALEIHLRQSDGAERILRSAEVPLGPL